MENWKKAFELSLLELKESTTGFFILLFFYLIITLYTIFSFPSYLENNFLGVDSLFIIAFTVAPLWSRPKVFQMQTKQNGYIVPSVVMLQHLPIPKDVIIKSRIIIHYVYTIPVQFILLLSLYLFSGPLQDMMTFGTYIVFMIIWFSFGIYVGGMFLASDMGDRTPPFKAIVYTIITIIVAIFLMTSMIILTGFGIVHWTLIFAQKWPLVSAMISIVLAILGYVYWYRYMKKQLRTLDYM